MVEPPLTPDDERSEQTMWFGEPYNVGLTAIINAAPDGIIIAKWDSREIVTLNETALDQLDRPRSQLVGEHHHVIHPPAERERAQQLFDLVASRDGDSVQTYADGEQIHLLTGDNERIPVEINVGVFELAGDRFIQGHFRDISERTEEAQLSRVFREAVEQAGHSIFITDANGYIEYANPAFEAISGYDREEVVGERPSILNSGMHDEAFYEELWSTITDGQVWRGEIINRRKDGSLYHIAQTIAPIFDDQGVLRHFVAVNQDITERNRRERQLERERQRLQEFATTIAHDLRTPLSVASAHVETAIDEEDEETLEPAVDALEQLDRLIGSLLSLSKKGETVHDPEQVRLQAAIERAWAMTKGDDAILVSDIPDELELSADKQRLQRLLLELFDNAITHGDPSSRIDVQSLAECNGFAIGDDGPGVSTHDRARIFDAGVSLDGERGYGLAYVQQITQAHGWELTVGESDRGGFEIAVHVPPCGCETGDDG